jgi:hypothetical protein
MTFYDSIGAGYAINYDCQDSEEYTVNLEEDIFRVVADNGFGKMVDVKFIRGKKCARVVYQGHFSYFLKLKPKLLLQNFGFNILPKVAGLIQ